MISGSLAKRYARALIELAPSAMVRDKYLKNLETLSAAVTADTPDGSVAALLDAGHLSLAKRKKIGAALCQRAGGDQVIGRFVDLLVERGRIGGLPLIARSYRDQSDEAAGRVRATVKSAKPLAADATNKIKAAITQATGKQVILETQVDPELIGGLVTTVGSYTLDGSVKASLARLRQTMHASS